MTDEIKHVKPDAEGQSGGEAEKASKSVSGELQERITRLEEGIASRDGELAALKEVLARAVAKYRAAILATSLGVPEELLKGETVEEIDASLEQARSIVSQVRQALEHDAAAKRIPAGAPIRSGPDLSGVSGEAKIQIALKQGA